MEALSSGHGLRDGEPAPDEPFRLLDLPGSALLRIAMLLASQPDTWCRGCSSDCTGCLSLSHRGYRHAVHPPQPGFSSSARHMHRTCAQLRGLLTPCIRALSLKLCAHSHGRDSEGDEPASSVRSERECLADLERQLHGSFPQAATLQVLRMQVWSASEEWRLVRDFFAARVEDGRLHGVRDLQVQHQSEKQAAGKGLGSEELHRMAQACPHLTRLCLWTPNDLLPYAGALAALTALTELELDTNFLSSCARHELYARPPPQPASCAQSAAVVASLTSLRKLTLVATDLGQLLPPICSSLTGLVSLHLLGPYRQHALVPELTLLQGLGRLTSLRCEAAFNDDDEDVAEGGISQATLSAFCGCTRLRDLDLWQINVRGDACVELLMLMPHLTSLEVNSLEPEHDLSHLATRCQWRELTLRDSRSPAHLQRLAAPLRCLEGLWVENHCWCLSAEGKASAATLRAAREVRAAAELLAVFRPVLRPLRLMWVGGPCPAGLGSTASVLAALAPLEPEMRDDEDRLGLACWSLDAISTRALARTLPQLRNLELYRSTLTKGAWRALRGLTALRSLGFYEGLVVLDDLVDFAVVAERPVAIGIEGWDEEQMVKVKKAIQAERWKMGKLERWVSLYSDLSEMWQ